VDEAKKIKKIETIWLPLRQTASATSPKQGRSTCNLIRQFWFNICIVINALVSVRQEYFKVIGKVLEPKYSCPV